MRSSSSVAANYRAVSRAKSTADFINKHEGLANSRTEAIDYEEKNEVADWFSALITQMKSQQIMEKGHLAELREFVEKFAEIHWSLLKTDSTYFETYSKAKPFIVEAVIHAKGENLGNEIQICLNGIYGLLLCRLLGKKVEDEQLKAAEIFGEILSILNFSYQQRVYLSPN